MKKLLYAMLAGVGMFVLVIVVGLGAAFAFPNYFKVINGEGIRTSDRVDAVITVDGVVQPDAYVFRHEDRDFFLTGSANQMLTLDMIVIDRKKKEGMVPNGGVYDLFFSRHLFVSQPYGVSMNSLKWEEDPKLQFDDDGYSLIVNTHEVKISYRK